jgi:hypothetical protein
MAATGAPWPAKLPSPEQDPEKKGFTTETPRKRAKNLTTDCTDSTDHPDFIVFGQFLIRLIRVHPW